MGWCTAWLTSNWLAQVVSGSILELRLLERIMRECYVDAGDLVRCQSRAYCVCRLLMMASWTEREAWSKKCP